MAKEVELNPGELPQGLVVVKFSTTWCGPCNALKPLYDALDYPESKVKILSINPENKPEWMRKYNFRSVPTTIGFMDNNEVFRVKGVDIKSIKKEIENHS